ncbi:MAG TPA: preprotein translocase subunit SecE [Phycisphaerales bacterium]|nr:preprotein translocase subunit SecE [Phycisphaerales bacterium]HCD34985.1 preprotein translocase subunit SecE [Phycisphaerales bacterium]|tara:strand:- start:140 stop:550 length:411 start_codon:yes stop_codon:yes gene_type:complete
MALTIKKSGQGYWTRMLSAIGAGIMLLGCLAWIWGELQSAISQDSTRTTVQAVIACLIVIGGGGICYWIMNKDKVVDFFIATESEMRKVNWPSKKELVGSTWVVIIGTVFLAAVLVLIDICFTLFFSEIGILHTGL